MRISSAFALALLLAARLAAADQRDPRLEPLFSRLAVADAVEARHLEAQILTIWSAVDDPEAQALLERGSVAMANRDYATAKTAFDALTSRFPHFAEGWNRRATLLWILGEHLAAVADLERTLALEPRHFGALSTLGLALLRLGAREAAQRAFEAALAIHPTFAVARYHVALLRHPEGEL